MQAYNYTTEAKIINLSPLRLWLSSNLPMQRRQKFITPNYYKSVLALCEGTESFWANNSMESDSALPASKLSVSITGRFLTKLIKLSNFIIIT